jgi:hypothetical protein
VVLAAINLVRSFIEASAGSSGAAEEQKKCDKKRHPGEARLATMRAVDLSQI